METNLRVKMIGLGGAGGNVVDYCSKGDEWGVNYIAVNSDIKALESLGLVEKVVVGKGILRGMGSGGDVQLARRALEEEKEVLEGMVEGVDFLILVVGLGGGMGSVLGQQLAQIGKRKGALVMVYGILPFSFEGTSRQALAQEMVTQVRGNSHLFIPLSNDLLLQELGGESTVMDAFRVANEWVNRGVKMVMNTIYKPGVINLDFGNFQRSFGQVGGKALYGLGRGSGENYVQNVLLDLWMCPMLHTSYTPKNCDSLLINIIGGRDLSLKVVNELVRQITQRFNARENVVIGAVIDDQREKEVEIVVIGVSEVRGGVTTMAKKVSAKGKVLRGDPNQQVLFDEEGQVATMVGEEGQESEEGKEGENGYFWETERYYFEGQDLDVPTYLRKGIKIR